MVSRTVLLVSLVVIAASLYAILSPEVEQNRVRGKITERPVELNTIKIEEIRIRYMNRSFNIDPAAPEARKLLYHVQQMLPQLEVELGNLSAFMSGEEIDEEMRNSSYVLLVFEREEPISFGEMVYPCRRLVVFLDGRLAGRVGVQPAGGAAQVVEPKWELAEVPEGNGNFSAVVDLIEEIS